MLHAYAAEFGEVGRALYRRVAEVAQHIADRQPVFYQDGAHDVRGVLRLDIAYKQPRAARFHNIHKRLGVADAQATHFVQGGVNALPRQLRRQRVADVECARRVAAHSRSHANPRPIPRYQRLPVAIRLRLQILVCRHILIPRIRCRIAAFPCAPLHVPALADAACGGCISYCAV